MLSIAHSITYGSYNRSVAMYKGLKVAVYSVDKPELSLTRQDLIELVNVRISLTDLFSHQLMWLFIYPYRCLYSFSHGVSITCYADALS